MTRRRIERNRLLGVRVVTWKCMRCFVHKLPEAYPAHEDGKVPEVCSICVGEKAPPPGYVNNPPHKR